MNSDHSHLKSPVSALGSSMRTDYVIGSGLVLSHDSTGSGLLNLCSTSSVTSTVTTSSYLAYKSPTSVLGDSESTDYLTGSGAAWSSNASRGGVIDLNAMSSVTSVPATSNYFTYKSPSSVLGGSITTDYLTGSGVAWSSDAARSGVINLSATSSVTSVASTSNYLAYKSPTSLLSCSASTDYLTGSGVVWSADSTRSGVINLSTTSSVISVPTASNYFTHKSPSSVLGGSVTTDYLAGSSAAWSSDTARSGVLNLSATSSVISGTTTSGYLGYKSPTFVSGSSVRTDYLSATGVASYYDSTGGAGFRLDTTSGVISSVVAPSYLNYTGPNSIMGASGNTEYLSKTGVAWSYRSAENFPLTLKVSPSTITEAPPNLRESLRLPHNLGMLSARAVGCESIEAFNIFVGAIRAVRVHLEDALVAGIEALLNRQRDSIRIAAHEGREVLNQVLRFLAPDSAFSEAEIEKYGFDGGITRSMRAAKIAFARCGYEPENEDSLLLQQEASAIITELNRLAHYQRRYSDADFETIKNLYRRLYRLLSVLLNS